MPLHTFLLGMLVRSLIVLLGSLLLVLSATRLPAPTINASRSGCSASTLLHVYDAACTAEAPADADLGGKW